MTFKLVILEPQDPGARTPAARTWPDKIRELVPGVDIWYCTTVEEAAEAIVDADAAFGDIVPELFERAQKLHGSNLRKPGRRPATTTKDSLRATWWLPTCAAYSTTT